MLLNYVLFPPSLPDKILLTVKVKYPLLSGADPSSMARQYLITCPSVTFGIYLSALVMVGFDYFIFDLQSQGLPFIHRRSSIFLFIHFLRKKMPLDCLHCLSAKYHNHKSEVFQEKVKSYFRVCTVILSTLCNGQRMHTGYTWWATI